MPYPANGSTNMKSQAGQCQKSKSRPRNLPRLVPLRVTLLEPQQRHATKAPPEAAGSVVIHHSEHDPCKQPGGVRDEEETYEEGAESPRELQHERGHHDARQHHEEDEVAGPTRRPAP